ncbi:hypothetical protein L195_g032683 [Trifolium pratense]|uniref:Uncharacterized protein n=1 Tax=Trifolium pratense TaxID=57577 RepID=A0A2K3LDV3_TRIPR|nr:hypothetical protein L195_g032683 [Trifolium pratense]
MKVKETIKKMMKGLGNWSLTAAKWVHFPCGPIELRGFFPIQSDRTVRDTSVYVRGPPGVGPKILDIGVVVGTLHSCIALHCIVAPSFS